MPADGSETRGASVAMVECCYDRSRRMSELKLLRVGSFTFSCL